ncbi:hypothetical protein DB34_01020 [Acetobacter pasteurianus]|nr:hypothetical protein DB34_01020 [Acetobacter pasteurianus]
MDEICILIFHMGVKIPHKKTDILNNVSAAIFSKCTCLVILYKDIIHFWHLQADICACLDKDIETF